MILKMKKVIKKLKGYLPVNRRQYVETLGHFIKLLEANDENHRLIRNDLYQLAVSIRNLKSAQPKKDKKLKDQGGMFA